ncbi:MAG: flagellar M-ring protein FliF [Candidatus Kapabacteria bacterium]|nr:flagellar M-ring protein FliF [Candidatus Kapabacteria bacterium]
MASLPILDQAKSLFSKFSTIQKVTVGIAVTAALAGIVLLFMTGSKTPMSVLYSDVEQKDAATIIEKLKEQNIQYELSQNGNTILVPSDKVHETRINLAKDGIPANSTVGYEIFDKTNLGMSDAVTKLNLKRATEGELQKTIAAFDEIAKVRVMIVTPEKTLFEKDQKKPTAAVHIHLKNGRSLDKLNIEGIQNLVAYSVEGLSPNDVTIVDQRGRMLSELKKDKSSLAGMSATQYEQQEKVDQYLISKVQSQLDGVLGAGNAVVRVNSDLDFSQLERTKENYDPDGQVVLSESKIAEKKKSQDSLEYPSVNSETNANKISTNYLNSKTVEHFIGNVGAIKRLSVSVLVNGTSKVIDKDGKQQIEYTPRSNEEMQKLTQIVRNTVGFDPQRNDQVSVVNMQFDTGNQADELADDKFSLNMTPNEIAEKVLILVAMILAVWMIRKLFASSQVRRKIEEILAPPQPKIEESPYQIALANSLNKLTGGMAIGPDGQLLPAGTNNLQLEEKTTINRDELLAKARARLDANTQSELSEDQMMYDEMRSRIQKFFEDNENDALKLVKIVLNKHESN